MDVSPARYAASHWPAKYRPDEGWLAYAQRVMHPDGDLTDANAPQVRHHLSNQQYDGMPRLSGYGRAQTVLAKLCL